MAATISFPTPQRTRCGFSAAPTPITEVVITCVDETGAPSRVERAIVAAEDTWESKEWIGSILKIRRPRVRMIRHPPPSVPRARRTAQVIRAQRGTSTAADSPAANLLGILRTLDEALADGDVTAAADAAAAAHDAAHDLDHDHG